MGASSIFNVTAHHELPGRGGFVLGTVRGEVVLGMPVHGAGSSRAYTVAGVESLSGNGAHLQALVFRGQPTLAEIVEAFPTGTAVFSVGSGSAL